jgi:hypothetical protein
VDARELIERGYRALGVGADDDVLAMFDQLGGEPALWVVYELGAFGRRHPASDVVAHEPAPGEADGDRPLPRASARELGGAGAALLDGVELRR